MLKRKDHAFGKDIYLLGVNKYGENTWLEAGKFDCGWYWGIGYIETYTNNKCPSKSRDIKSHTHFDSLFFNKNKHAYDVFKEYFVKTPLNDKEIWRLLELMKTLYILRQYSDTIYRGGAHYTNNPCKDIIKNESEYNRINTDVIPKLLDEIYKLLSPNK